MSDPILSNVRRATIRAFSLGIITGSFLTAGMVLLAGPARDLAALDKEYIYHSTCSALGIYPAQLLRAWDLEEKR